ncbi:MAG: VPLPA-CTERM sorting domain-containing protein [Rhodocyclaceae bacterium]|nr:VPLPA-CTERM sorting domain-containing protein [Rhodocyclaceae bacterium]
MTQTHALHRSVLLGFVLCAGGTAVQAATISDFVPGGVDCQFSPTRGTICGLYTDLSGNASVNWAGSDSFSHQPEWAYAAYRSVGDSASAMGSVSSSEVSASDFVTFGALKSQLSAGSSSSGAAYTEFGPPHTGASSSSTIAFQDRLTFSAEPSLTGTLGTMVGRIQVTGGVSASPATYPASSSSASAGVTVQGGGTYSVAAYGDKPGTGGIPQYLTFSLPVKFNSIDFTLLYMSLQTSVNTGVLWGSGSNIGVSAVADYFSTLQWLGIDGVFDSSGNAITAWSVDSGSGFDYSQSYASQLTAVPLPAAGWLIGSSMLVLLGVVRRRLA